MDTITFTALTVLHAESGSYFGIVRASPADIARWRAIARAVPAMQLGGTRIDGVYAHCPCVTWYADMPPNRDGRSAEHYAVLRRALDEGGWVEVDPTLLDLTAIPIRTRDRQVNVNATYLHFTFRTASTGERFESDCLYLDDLFNK